MKKISKIIAIGCVSALMGVLACEEPFSATPVPATAASNYKAFFIFGNASDATLDFYANNVLTTAGNAPGDGETVYTKSAIPSNGGFANFNIRAKGSSGSIGGTLGSSDAVFRAANNNSNNLTALDSAYYTVIVLDTASRPAPLRKYNQTTNFADATLFNPLTSEQLAVSDTVGAGFSAYERSQMILIGTVPLGSSDPGGPRFLVITDQLPLPSTTRLPKPAAGKAGVRFVNGVGDGTMTVTVDGTADVGLGGISYPLSTASLNPSVGSRTQASLNFNTTVTAESVIIRAKYTPTGAEWTLPVDLADGGLYTFFATGSRKANTVVVGFIKNK